ncbi:MAG: aminotransferase class I/II-fold pyridoxal phosphate-dependent enzyme [Pseudomonadota bacterium]
MSILNLMRPDLRDFSLYTAGDGDDSRVRLHANELPYRAKDDHSARGLNRYPLGRDQRLTKRLAELYGIAPDNVLATRGSDDGIDLLIRGFGCAGRSRVLSTSPGFTMYPQLAALQGCHTDMVPLSAGDHFVVQADAIVDACTPDTSLVFLCSPNNPSGRTLDTDTIRNVCEARRDQSLVVIDEAYAEFSRHPSAIELLETVENLAVLRTMSKAYGLASARVGAIVAGTELIGALDRMMMPFPLPAASVQEVLTRTEGGALTALQQNWREIVAERERVAHALAGHPQIARVWPSDANFLLLDCSTPASLVEHCRERGLLVRLISGSERAFVRVTIGRPIENDLFLGALSEQAA